jgi:hypothetical protein
VEMESVGSWEGWTPSSKKSLKKIHAKDDKSAVNTFGLSQYRSRFQLHTSKPQR